MPEKKGLIGRLFNVSPWTKEKQKLAQRQLEYAGYRRRILREGGVPDPFDVWDKKASRKKMRGY